MMVRPALGFETTAALSLVSSCFDRKEKKRRPKVFPSMQIRTPSLCFLHEWRAEEMYHSQP